METKQFPEKWAVADTKEARVFLKKISQLNLIGDCSLFTFSEGGVANEFFYGFNGVKLWHMVLVEGHTEVTLKDLIAHYEGKKKVVKCKDNGLSVLALTVDKEYIVESEATNYFRIADDMGIYGNYAKARFIDPTTHPKWMPLTRGGFPINIIREDIGDGVMSTEVFKDNMWVQSIHTKDGNYYTIDLQSPLDLIPYNPRIEELEEKITSKRSELAELEGELNTLKQK